MTELYLADQWLLWILVPLFMLWLGAWWVLPWLARRRGRRAAVKYSSVDTLKRLKPSRRIVLRRFVEGCGSPYFIQYCRCSALADVYSATGRIHCLYFSIRA